MRALILFLLLPVAAAAQQTTFVLDTGKSIDGEVIKETDLAYTLKVKYGTIEIAKNKLAKAEAVKEVAVSVKKEEPIKEEQLVVKESAREVREERRPTQQERRKLSMEEVVLTYVPMTMEEQNPYFEKIIADRNGKRECPIKAAIKAGIKKAKEKADKEAHDTAEKEFNEMKERKVQAVETGDF